MTNYLQPQPAREAAQPAHLEGDPTPTPNPNLRIWKVTLSLSLSVPLPLPLPLYPHPHPHPHPHPRPNPTPNQAVSLTKGIGSDIGFNVNRVMADYVFRGKLVSSSVVSSPKAVLLTRRQGWRPPRVNFFSSSLQ